MLQVTIRRSSKIALIPAAVAACLLSASCTTATSLPELPSISQQALPAVTDSAAEPALAPALANNEEKVRRNESDVAYEIVDLTSILVE
jgi:hypothetical protein